MEPREVKKALLRAVNTFEKEYTEWENYQLLLKPDKNTIEINGMEGKLNTKAAKELLRDFASVLKREHLMIASQKASEVEVDEYAYLAQEGLEDLADELETQLGKGFSNLVVSERNNKPFVKFTYIGSPTSKDKKIMLDAVQKIVDSYTPVEEGDVFANVEFDDIEDIEDTIEEENLAEQIQPDEVKAEDMLGGVAEGLTAEDIAERHDVDSDYIEKQITRGIKVEMEHTEDEEIAREITLDHLYELPDYYERLGIMEEDAEEEIVLSDGVEDEDDIKAEDSTFPPGIYYHGYEKFNQLPESLTSLLDRDSYSRAPYDDMVEGDWKHDQQERNEFIEKYIRTHVIVDVDTKEDYIILLAINPLYIHAEDEALRAEDAVEVDYTDYVALADLYDQLWEHLNDRSNNRPGAIAGGGSLVERAFQEIDDYMSQFGPIEETVDETLAKLTPEEIEGYVQIINKWMNV